MSCVLIDARTGTARSKTRTTRPLLTLIPRLPPHLPAASPPPVCLLRSARTVRSSSACAPHRESLSLRMNGDVMEVFCIEPTRMR
ncbi:hypothetical protein ILYODFUR_006300 [Ilyodon furcidens]|uniref:Uncharacterized protein n=1 Tax=Ilyodon furcidens TaxID=33524 RepID=A0ABV0T5N7_9TELE